MAKHASAAIRSESGRLLQVLGGMSLIDTGFIQALKEQGVLDSIDVVASHGFPLDWNHWTIHEWPQKLNEIRISH